MSRAHEITDLITSNVDSRMRSIKGDSVPQVELQTFSGSLGVISVVESETRKIEELMASLR